jgi:hypothetical protein
MSDGNITVAPSKDHDYMILEPNPYQESYEFAEAVASVPEFIMGILVKYGEKKELAEFLDQTHDYIVKRLTGFTDEGILIDWPTYGDPPVRNSPALDANGVDPLDAAVNTLLSAPLEKQTLPRSDDSKAMWVTLKPGTNEIQVQELAQAGADFWHGALQESKRRNCLDAVLASDSDLCASRALLQSYERASRIIRENAVDLTIRRQLADLSAASRQLAKAREESLLQMQRAIERAKGAQATATVAQLIGATASVLNAVEAFSTEASQAASAALAHYQQNNQVFIQSITNYYQVILPLQPPIPLQPPTVLQPAPGSPVPIGPAP